MSRLGYGRLVTRAFYELVRFDLVHGLLKLTRMSAPPVQHVPGDAGHRAGSEADVCDAVVLAACLYWKPVFCLQRSVCAMRMLRARGVDARVVIGYRPVPFFSHAWVEVAGRVVNDSPVYQKRLTVLHTI